MTTLCTSPIIVQLTGLPQTGLTIEASLEAAGLNARLMEGRPTDIIFSGPASVKVVVTPSIAGFLARGRVTAPYTQCCGRCDDRLDRTVDAPVDVVLKPRPAGVPVDSDEFAEDIGLSFYSGDSIDLAPLLEELIILQLSFFWHPAQAPDGSCLQCGLCPQKFVAGTEPERSPTINLGSLLRNAKKRGGQG